MNTKELDRAYVANTYARFPLELVRGHGSIAVDETGREYIDLGTGIAVNSFGYADPVWVQAVATQAATLQHASNLYYTAPCAHLAAELCRRTGMKKVFFSNSGAEANECAIKVARKYAEAKRGPGCHTIITLENSFHGRTVTTLAATGQAPLHQHFTPLTEGFVYAAAGDLAGVEALCDAHDVAAILFEPVQGEGGVIPLSTDFVKGLFALARSRDILLLADEVQTGNGRSGSLYACMEYGVTPDVLSTAKGLAGGLPLGATLLGERVQDVLVPGDHGSTFGGNPVACAGALTVLERLTPDFLAEVRRKSALVFEALSGAPGVVGVTGLGLMLGVETTRPAGEVLSDCMAAGVLVLKAKNKIRLLPALNIPEEQLLKALDVLKAACAGKETA